MEHQGQYQLLNHVYLTLYLIDVKFEFVDHVC
jgi:hypothetical protein